MDKNHHQYKIIDSTISDLDNILQCHRLAFPKTISARLGIPLQKKILEWYVNSNRGFMFHININNEVVGYCGGIKTLKPNLEGAASTISQYAFNEFLIAYLKRPWLLFHFENWSKYSLILKNVIYKIFKKRKEISKKMTSDFTPFFGLIVIGVNPNYHGEGFGTILLQEFEKKAIEENIDLISLSVKPSNVKAIRVYNKNGWEEKNRINKSITMIKNL